MPIELHCEVCGRRYSPTLADLWRGPEVYRICPDCRPVDVVDPEVTVQ